MTSRPRNPRAESPRARAWAISTFAHAAGVVGALALGTAAAVEADWSATSDMPSRSSLWAEATTETTSPTTPPMPTVAVELPPVETALVDPVLPLPLPLAATPPLDPPPMPSLAPAPRWLESLVAQPAAAAPTPQPQDAEPTEPTEPAQAAAAAPMGAGFVQPAPHASDNAPPRYPFVAWRRGIEGRVVVILEIDDRGTVTDAHVETSSGNSQLDDAALQALRDWRFTPAHRGERAVRGTWRQVVEFRLTGEGVALPAGAAADDAG